MGILAERFDEGNLETVEIKEAIAKYRAIRNDSGVSGNKVVYAENGEEEKVRGFSREKRTTTNYTDGLKYIKSLKLAFGQRIKVEVDGVVARNDYAKLSSENNGKITNLDTHATPEEQKYIGRFEEASTADGDYVLITISTGSESK